MLVTFILGTNHNYSLIQTYCKYNHRVGFNGGVNVNKPNNMLNITQKKNNPKGTIGFGVLKNTFSVGSVVRYLHIKQEKALRRSHRGSKIFFNFLKSVFFKKYPPQINSTIILSIRGCDYNIYKLSRMFYGFFDDTGTQQKCFLLFNMLIAFTKKKEGHKKSIKKRLRKNILKVFLKPMEL